METDNIKLLTGHPYLSKKTESFHIMISIIVSLIPIIAFAIYKYKINAIIHIAITVIVCVCTDYLYKFFTKQDISVNDGSSIVTGVMISLLLPAYAPYWVGALGGVFAILIAKQMFGGIGNCIVNPVCAAFCFLCVSVPRYMDNFVVNGNANIAFDMIKDNKTVDAYRLMIGNIDGSMGEVCAIALLIGAVIAVLLGVVDIYIPAVYIVTFSIFVLILGGRGLDFNYLTVQLASGGFLFAVWFVAADFTSSPIIMGGQVIYGIMLGILTALSRVFGQNANEIYFIILFANLCVGLIENITIPKPFIKEVK